MSTATSKIQSVQHWRKHVLRLLFLGLVVLVLFSQSLWAAGDAVHEALEYAGMALIGTAILGRTWSSLYIGGRKNAELMQDGPYSLMRNPLYTFSFIGAPGTGSCAHLPTRRCLPWQSLPSNLSRKRKFSTGCRLFSSCLDRLTRPTARNKQFPPFWARAKPNGKVLAGST